MKMVKRLLNLLKPGAPLLEEEEGEPLEKNTKESFFIALRAKVERYPPPFAKDGPSASVQGEELTSVASNLCLFYFAKKEEDK